MDALKVSPTLLPSPGVSEQEKIPVISRDQVVDRYLAVFLTLGFELNTLETLVVGNKMLMNP